MINGGQFEVGNNQLMQEEREGNPEETPCQVCFLSFKSHTKHSQLISCSSCHLPAHRACYFPSSTTWTFVCDSCKRPQNKQNSLCRYCSNQEGLMKAISDQLAHPVCLFFRPEIAVEDYGKLVFREIEGVKGSGKKTKCELCQKSSGNVIGCGSSQKCKRRSHLFCALRLSCPSEESCWRLYMQPLLDGDFAECSTNLFERTVRTNNHFLAARLGIPKSIKKRAVDVNLYCSEHSGALVDCRCMTMDEAKVNWVYCESCTRWEHWECAGIQKEVSEADYSCSACFQWKDWTNETQKGQYPMMPKVLPKLLLFDLIYLEWLVERSPQSSVTLLNLVERIPLLPSLAYGEQTFRQQIACRLKPKINFIQLKRTFEDLAKGDQTESDLVKDLKSNWREELELIRVLVEGSLFSNDAAVYNVEVEEMEREYVQKQLDILNRYELRFLRNPEEEDKPKPSIRSRGSGKNQEKLIKTREEVLEEVCQKMKIFVSMTQETLTGTKQQIKHYFEELHRLKRLAAPEGIFQELPTSLFTRSFLPLRNANDSVTFLSYLGELNRLEQDWLQFVGENGKVPFEEWERAEKFWLRGSLLKEHMLNCVEDDALQLQLLQLIFEGETEGKLPTGLQLTQQLPDFEKPLGREFLNIRKLKGVVAISQQNGDYPVHIHLALSILQQLKVARFDLKTRGRVEGVILNQEGKELTAIIVELLQEYICFRNAMETFLSSLKVSYSHEDCLVERLAELQLFKGTHKEKEEAAFLRFLLSIRAVRLSFFSLSLQMAVKNKLIALLQHFNCKRGPLVTAEKELECVKVWMARYGLKATESLQTVIESDRVLFSQSLSEKHVFDNPSKVRDWMFLLKRHEQVYQKAGLCFRVKKIKVCLEWIALFHKITGLIPIDVLLDREKWSRKNVSRKCSMRLASVYGRMLQELRFPKGQFRERFEEALLMGTELVGLFKNLTESSQYDFVNYEDVKWEEKTEMSAFRDFLVKAEQCPISLGAEIKECQIILEKVEHYEKKAIELLSSKDSFNFRRDAIRLVEALGAFPIASQVALTLINKIPQIQSSSESQPNSEDQKAETKLNNLLSSHQVPYDEACCLLTYFESNYRGKREQQVDQLRKMVEGIKRRIDKYQKVLEVYMNQERLFENSEMQVIEKLVKEQERGREKVFHNGLDKLCVAYITFRMFEQTAKYKHLRVMSQEERAREQLQANYIHPCFHFPIVTAFKDQ